MSHHLRRLIVFVSLGGLLACSGGNSDTTHTVTPDTAPDTFPDTSPTDTDLPDTTNPDVPDTATDTAIPDTHTPDTTIPDTHTPDTVVSNPCGTIPTTGRCEGNTVAVCVAGTGSVDPFVSRTRCPAGTTCGTGQYGATCVLTAECADFASECRGNTLAFCENNRWVTSACPGGCNSTIYGAACRTTRPTTTYRNTLEYELRIPNAPWTDWSDELYSSPAVGFLVQSFIDDELHDTTVTDIHGAFELDVAAVEGDADYVVIATLGLDQTRTRIAYSVMSPNLAPGEVSLNDFLDTDPADAMPHYWVVSPSVLPSDSGLYLPLDAGSGAAFAFDYLGLVHDFARDFYGARAGTELVFWMGFDTSWDCGACFIRYPTTAWGDRYEAQIFMPADAQDEPYWSDAVIAHELGHWLMSTFGFSPGEGGQHIMGIPSHPGLAWSEGFATWFSMLARGASDYYDKQGGLFLWIDVGQRTYGQGLPWPLPLAHQGLEQLIDENEVAHMLLALSDDTTIDPMLAALASDRMTEPPFARGYTRRAWDGLSNDFLPEPWTSTGEPAPHFADFLDALVCDGALAASDVDLVTEPARHYPFPSRQPRCQHTRQPLEVTWLKRDQAEVRWFVPLPAPLHLKGAEAVVIDAHTPAGVITVAAPDGLEVALDSPVWRVHGRSRPDRPLAAKVPTKGDTHGLARPGFNFGGHLAQAPRARVRPGPTAATGSTPSMVRLERFARARSLLVGNRP